MDKGFKKLARWDDFDQQRGYQERSYLTPFARGNLLKVPGLKAILTFVEAW